MPSISPSDRWLIGLDIDGTLVHDDGYLSPEVAREVQRVKDLGHEVIIATGRAAANAVPVVRDLLAGLAPPQHNYIYSFYIYSYIDIKSAVS